MDHIVSHLKGLFKKHGLKKKRLLWYYVDSSGIRGIALEKNRWNTDPFPEYEPHFYYYPAQYIDFDTDEYVPPYYKSCIRDHYRFIKGVNWKEDGVLFNANSIPENFEARMTALHVNIVFPILLRLVSVEAAIDLVRLGRIGHPAISMPARETLLERMKSLKG